MTKKDIISAVEAKRGITQYFIWTIGVTDEAETRKSQHSNDKEDVTYWSQWKTDTEQDGRDIEKYFLDKGMKGDTGGGGNAGYVYVF